MATYIGQALPAKIVRVSATTLFRVAALELGDALAWTRIAALNNISDPWISSFVTLKIPQKAATTGGGVPIG